MQVDVTSVLERNSTGSTKLFPIYPRPSPAFWVVHLLPQKNRLAQYVSLVGNTFALWHSTTGMSNGDSNDVYIRSKWGYVATVDI